MKIRVAPLIFLVLALVLFGLSACTASQSDAKVSKASALEPQTVDVEVEEAMDQPSYIEVDPQTDWEDCTFTDPHPIGQSIAQTYQVSYQQVMTWFCSGYSFDNILIALETSAAVDIPPDVLLNMLLEKEWEEIWEQVGLTGSP